MVLKVKGKTPFQNLRTVHPMKNHLATQIVTHNTHKTIYTTRENLILDELPWQKCGLIQTSSGYGRKLTSRYKIMLEGKKFRVYVTQIANAGSYWIITGGVKIFIDA